MIRIVGQHSINGRDKKNSSKVFTDDIFKSQLCVATLTILVFVMKFIPISKRVHTIWDTFALYMHLKHDIVKKI